MDDYTVEQKRTGVAFGLMMVGGFFSLTVVGLVIGIPMILAGFALGLHTWWRDFDDDADAEPA